MLSILKSGLHLNAHRIRMRHAKTNQSFNVDIFKVLPQKNPKVINLCSLGALNARYQIQTSWTFSKKKVQEVIVVLFVWARVPSCWKKHFRSFRPSWEMKSSIKYSYWSPFTVVVKKKGPTIFSLDVARMASIFRGWRGLFHQLMRVGGWPGSKNLHVYVSTQMEPCYIGKLKFIEHVLVRCEIKNPATKFNASCSISGLQFVTYAKFIRVSNISHRFVGRRLGNTNTLSELRRRDGGCGRQSSPYFLNQFQLTNAQLPGLLRVWNLIVLFKMIDNSFNLHFRDVCVIFVKFLTRTFEQPHG